MSENNPLYAIGRVGAAFSISMLMSVTNIMASDNIVTYEEKDGYTLVHQSQGPTLGYSKQSGAKIIMVDGLAFKSFNGSDTLFS